ncbi:hypothetical protein I5N37_04975 [Serratia marcescens]|uniref:hypothetical protein n=1 Tax=Serratia TaxID=613 RepID=UPI0013300654|nr:MULTISPECIES: hypothetical protein [Serratia]MBH3270707.1 hypothetical protein [Serratia marcescens]MDI3150639.1 hypothetical protein [Serratia nevei]
MLRIIILLPVLFYTLVCQAVSVNGAFSDWYWQSGKKWGAMDFSFSDVRFDNSDPIFDSGRVWCSGGYKCMFVVQVWTKSSSSYYSLYSRAINPGSNNVYYTVDEFNQAVKNMLPFTGTISYDPFIGCIKFLLSTGDITSQLASTCDGTLPPPPPPPSVPVFCNVSGLSRDFVDFGLVTQGTAVSQSITASLSCSGAQNTLGKARLMLTDVGRTGSNTAILRNAQSGDEIKVRLSVGNENGANDKRMDVKTGYQADVPLFFQVDANETINKPGYFSGSALLIFDVL